MTNKLLATAGVLSLILTAVHVFGGGADVHVPLLESNAADVVKGFASVVWHGVTVALLMCSVLLFMAARHEAYRTMLTGIVIVFYLAFAGLFMVYGILRFGTVFLMLPWIGFLVVVGVAALGLWMDARGQIVKS